MGSGIEFPNSFPYMDSDGYSNGQFGTAHRRRELIRGNNRLAARGHHGFHIVQSSSINNLPADIQDGRFTIRGYGFPSWVRMVAPIPFSKKPKLTKMRIRLRFIMNELAGWATTVAARNKRALWVQVETTASPFNPNSTPTNDPEKTKVLIADGSNAMQVVEWDSINLDPGSSDMVTFWFMGGLSDESIDPALGSQTGTNQQDFMADGQSSSIKDTSANWSVTLPSVGAWIGFAGLTHQAVVSGISDNPHHYLMFTPSYPGSLLGDTYSLYYLQPWRILSISAYVTDRER